MLVRASMVQLRNQGIGVVSLNRREKCKYLCCKINSLKLISFYFFAIITIISRAVLMTLAIILTHQEQLQTEQLGWYWLIEAGPYAYILSGNVIIIFLIDLYVKLSERGKINRLIMYQYAGKTCIGIGMCFVTACYIIPGTILIAYPQDILDEIIQR